MKEIYGKLNYYLNEICKYLEKHDTFLLDNIFEIAKLNHEFLKRLENYNLNNETKQNKLTFEDVFALAREIIESIDTNYLESFDNLIKSGELDFSFANDYEDSHCISIYKGKQVTQLININREFNYNDVILLIHEFIHYTNGKEDTKNRYYFTEFLSIYFEFYAVEYLLKKGINKDEVDYFHRIKNVRKHSIIFFQYEVILLAFIKFGNLDKDTSTLLKQNFLSIKDETFEGECTNLYKNLILAEQINKEKIEQNPNLMGQIISEEFMTQNYRYILGTFLAIYAFKYARLGDIVYLNNHINEYEGKSVYDVCLSIGIDLKDKKFISETLLAMDEYIDNKNKFTRDMQK